MLFARREKPKFMERVRVSVWPRRNWSRSMRYVSKRVLRLSGSPHAVAAGFASGALASCTPLVGFHFLLGMAVAFLTRGNLLASALGTAIGNPLTFPFIWAGTYRLGHLILQREGEASPPIDISHKLTTQSFDTIWPLLEPMLVASVPVGLITWVIFYFVVRRAVRSYQESRKKRFLDRRHARTLARAEMGAEMGGEA